MNPRVYWYVAGCVLGAGVLSALVYGADPAFVPDYLRATLSFAILGIAGQAVSHQRQAKGAYGSIAFLPFLAMIVLAPHWIALAGIAAIMIVAELIGRRAFVKVIFNVSQGIIAAGISILAFRWMGGGSLLANQFTLAAGLVALPAFLIANTLLLYGVIALSTRQRFMDLLAEYDSPRILYDLLALPFVYVFAWVYVQTGWMGALTLAVPLFGARELYKTNDALRRTNQELLELMVAAIEARDPYTSGHSRRVAANSRVIAEMLGLKRKEVERVAVAALLHDVGKIHEEFGPILSKPARLTAEENAIMQTHSAKGAVLVSTVSQLHDVVPAIRNHHENWDGSGYPDRLSGQSIPLASRIIMFADTIDAMVSDRPYRPGMAPFQVRAEIARLRGKQFDPTIADALLNSSVWDALFVNAPQHLERAGEHVPAGPRRTQEVPA